MVARHDYDKLAEQGLRELLDVEHAIVWQEAQAKLADRQWESLPVPIDPHHLTTARRTLLARGVIEELLHPTRGGRKVSVLIPADRHRQERLVQDAAARKRLLQTRFITWASGSASTGAGVIGKAGEQVVHAALTAAAPYGYRLLNPVGGETRTLLGAPVPGGSLDNAAFQTTMDAAQLTPTGQYVVLIEVKNIREWIYPSAAELHQLLDKAAQLQQSHPDRRFLPVLVCRRQHDTAARMAHHLGFYVIATKRQYVPPSLAGPDLDAVRAGLGYDLEPWDERPPPAMVQHFSTTLQGVAERTASRWPTTAATLGDYFTTLRDARLPGAERTDLVAGLREDAIAALGPPTRSW
jgi:hypothetical protein